MHQDRVHFDGDDVAGEREQFLGQRAFARPDFDDQFRRARRCAGGFRDPVQDGFAGEEMLSQPAAQVSLARRRSSNRSVTAASPKSGGQIRWRE